MGLFRKKSKKEFELPSELEIPPPPPELLEFPTEEKVREEERIKEESSTEEERIPEEVTREEIKLPEIKVEEEKKLEETEKREKKFIKVSDYKTIMAELTQMIADAKELQSLVSRIDEFKNDEDREFKDFRKLLDESQKNLLKADKILFEG